MNLATFVGSPAATLSDEHAWDTYLRAARDQIFESRRLAVDALNTLTKTREAFGEPLVVPGEAAGSVSGALSPAQLERFDEIQIINDIAIIAADEVLANKRPWGYNSTTNEVEIGSLPTDAQKVVVTNGFPTLAPISGAVQGLGNPIVWGGLAVGAVAIVSVSAYLIIDSNNEQMKSVAEQKTLQTALKHQADLVASGEATPEQAARMSSTVFRGASQLNRAKAEAAEKEKQASWQGTVKAVGWMVVGVAGIFFLAKVVPVAIEAGGGRL